LTHRFIITWQYDPQWDICSDSSCRANYFLEENILKIEFRSGNGCWSNWASLVCSNDSFCLYCKWLFRGTIVEHTEIHKTCTEGKFVLQFMVWTMFYMCHMIKSLIRVGLKSKWKFSYQANLYICSDSMSLNSNTTSHHKSLILYKHVSKIQSMLYFIR
jgi:hypothetical protein